jgi:hypothetical protein
MTILRQTSNDTPHRIQRPHAKTCAPRKEFIMATKVPWETDFELALKMSKTSGKPVLLDFYNPG